MTLPAPKTIITAHQHADFDAIASMVAANKLYPDATLVMPLFLTRQKTHPFTEAIVSRFNMVSPKDCDLSKVSLLVVVDTCQKDRIDHVHTVFDNQGLRIHVYDHHPKEQADIPAEFSDTRIWGSTTAILATHIQERGLTLTPDEATMLGLGIYEDTGSFSFSSTTEHDFRATAFIISQGMDLGTITTIVSTAMTRQQIHMLDALLKSAVTHTIRGIPITFVEMVLDEYQPNFSDIVDELMEVEKLKVICSITAMGDRIHLICRSAVDEIDVGKICAAFGGGGHRFAAAASIKNLTIVDVKGKLLTILVSAVTPKMTIASQMTSPAKTISKLTSLEEAEVIMNRYGLKAVPVLNDQTGLCVGLLDLQTAARAHVHQLGHLPVSEYMQQRFYTLTPDDELYKAIEIILQKRQRLIPVIQEKGVVGVLTRTDILRLLVNETFLHPENMPQVQDSQEKNITSEMQRKLPPETMRMLQAVGSMADLLGMNIYVVGGFVRDLLLGQTNLDIDLSIEGDSLIFAEALARHLKGSVRAYKKFNTATVFYTGDKNEKKHLDIAAARLEYYERPGALPNIEFASIKMDLFRRDFTINAMAVQLNSHRFGSLIDPFGGQRDLRQKRTTVIHSLSFVEDPTRILRAIRFEQRFHFTIDPQTGSLIKNALSLNMLAQISRTRLFNEMQHLFEEKNALACIKRMEEWSLLTVIHPKLRLTVSKEKLLTSIEDTLSWYKLLYKKTAPNNFVLYLLGLCHNCKYTDASDIFVALGSTEKIRKEFLQLRNTVNTVTKELIETNRKEEESPPQKKFFGRLHELLAPLHLEGQLYLLASLGHIPRIGQDISLFLTTLKYLRPDITGHDLLSLGFAPGPYLGHVMHRILIAKLNGLAPTANDQLALARDLLAQHTALSGNIPPLEP